MHGMVREHLFSSAFKRSCYIMYFMLRHLIDHFPLSPQLLQIFLILCSIWTTTSSTGKDLMSGSCTAWGPLLNRQRRGWRPPSPAVLSSRGWDVSLSVPARGSQRLHPTASVASQASTQSVHTEWALYLAVAATRLPSIQLLADGKLWKQTQTHSIRMNFSCLSGIHSVACQAPRLRDDP